MKYTIRGSRLATTPPERPQNNIVVLHIVHYPIFPPSLYAALYLSACYSYPRLGHWEGDGLENAIGIGAVGRILSEYAKACVKEV